MEMIVGEDSRPTGARPRTSTTATQLTTTIPHDTVGTGTQAEPSTQHQDDRKDAIDYRDWDEQDSKPLLSWQVEIHKATAHYTHFAEKFYAEHPGVVDLKMKAHKQGCGRCNWELRCVEAKNKQEKERLAKVVAEVNARQRLCQLHWDYKTLEPNEITSPCLGTTDSTRK